MADPDNSEMCYVKILGELYEAETTEPVKALPEIFYRLDVKQEIQVFMETVEPKDSFPFPAKQK